MDEHRDVTNTAAGGAISRESKEAAKRRGWVGESGGRDSARVEGGGGGGEEEGGRDEGGEGGGKEGGFATPSGDGAGGFRVAERAGMERQRAGEEHQRQMTLINESSQEPRAPVAPPPRFWRRLCSYVDAGTRLFQLDILCKGGY